MVMMMGRRVVQVAGASRTRRHVMVVVTVTGREVGRQPAPHGKVHAGWRVFRCVRDVNHRR